MIKYSDVNRAVVSKLNDKFPGIKIISADVKEGITRPSFRIKLDNIKESNFMNVSRDRRFIVRLYYFASTREDNKLEILDTIDSLSEIFVQDKLIKINDEFTIDLLEDVDIDVIDSVLHFYIPIFLSEDIEINVSDDQTELMQELEIN